MRKDLIIELRGVEFVNKGAELMLYSILAKVRDRNPSVKFVMERSQRAPISKHREAGIFTKAKFKMFRINLSPLFSFVPRSILLKFNVIKEGDINVVFDASGFAFGDQWGYVRAGFRLADHIEKWKNNQKLVIVLPQAFGPFTERALIGKMKKIIKYADLIFARDRMSYEYLIGVGWEGEKIKLRPDFTNITKGKIPSYFDKKVHSIAIIPNSKMVETSNDNGKAYFNLLNRIVKYLIKRGNTPYFLIHESKMDRGIAETINNSLKTPLDIVQEDNSLYVKGIIGLSAAVITSRFHGLVSCLAQGIPCLATGWSHKYQMLLEDYKYQEALIDVNIENELLYSALDNITDPQESEQIRSKLLKESIEQKQKTEDMWEIVFKLIESRK